MMLYEIVMKINRNEAKASESDHTALQGRMGINTSIAFLFLRVNVRMSFGHWWRPGGHMLPVYCGYTGKV